MMLITLFGIGFEAPLFLLLAIIAIAAFLFFNRGVLRKNPFLLAIRCAVLAALFLVLAMPYAVTEEDVLQETTSVLVVDDRTDSMSLLQSSGPKAAELIGSRLSGISKVELINMTAADSTALGDSLYQGILGSNLKSNVIVLSTDARNNRGADPLDVAAFAAETNSKIFGLLPELVQDEMYLSDITGAKKVPIHSEYPIGVVIGKVGSQASYTLTISVDGKPVLESPFVQSIPFKEFSLDHVFETRGPHNITARISPGSGDTFVQNNVFNKVVDVIEKPRVLLVTDSDHSPLRQVLGEVYDLDVKERLPAVLDRYTAIVLDDQPADRIGDVIELRDFLNDGGGLVVVGGNDSYAYGGYYESPLESLLPVKSKEAPAGRGKQINAVILIDISGSTGNTVGGDTKIDVEKAIAVKMIRDLSDNANIGVAAFNSDSFSIQPIRKVIDTRLLEDKVSRLRFGGGTYVLIGLKRARDMLGSSQGSKYVILISDGITNYPIKAFEEASAMAADGIIIHAVGVGFDTDQAFMRGLARRGNGIYFAPRESGRVKIVLGGLEEEDYGDGFLMVLTDAHHFITEGLEMANVSVESFNEATSKYSAQVLAATPGMKPLLAVWRFGLGRVACLTVDNGGDWAGLLYGEGSSRLVSSTVNWAIGDPERKKELRIDCIDTRVGGDASVIVSSKEPYPEVRVDGERVELNRLDEKNYYFEYAPERTGFVPVETEGDSCTMGVNYAEEYGELGADSDLLNLMADMTGGGVYESGDVDALVDAVSGHTVSESTGVIIEKRSMQLWFAMAALLLFFADIAIRRIRVIWRSKSHGGKAPKQEKGPRSQKEGAAKEQALS